MSTLWFARRLLLRTPRRSLATLVGIALAAGMLGAVLFFVTASSRTMTQRAVGGVVVDLQAELQGGSGSMAGALPHPARRARMSPPPSASRWPPSPPAA